MFRRLLAFALAVMIPTLLTGCPTGNKPGANKDFDRPLPTTRATGR